MSRKTRKPTQKENQKEKSQNDKPTWGTTLGWLDFVWKPAIFFILTTLSILFVCPFVAKVSLPSLGIVAATLVTVYIAVKRRRRYLLVVAAMLFLVAIAWATIGIFVVLPGTIYCFQSEFSNPLAATFSVLGSRDQDGGFLYLTDPIRSSQFVKRLVQYLRPQLVFLEPTTLSEQDVIRIPLTTAIVHTVRGTNPESSATELLVSYYGPGLRVYADSKALYVALGLKYFVLVDDLQKAARPLSWDVVLLNRQKGKDSAFYIANTDSGLAAAMAGDFEKAIGDLETAFAYAPSDLERARNRALLGQISFAILNGNIGETQALSYFNQAMQYWPLAAIGKPIQDSTLTSSLDAWLYQVLSRTFLLRENEYPQWTKILRLPPPPSWALERPKFQNWQLSPLGEGSLVSAEGDRIIRLIENNASTDEVRRYVAEHDGWSPEVRRWLAELLVGRNSPSEHLADVSEWAIQQMPEPWRSRYSKVRRHEITLRALVEFMITSTKEFGFYSISAVFSQMYAAEIASADLALADVGMPPKSSWWQSSFIDWFGAKLFFVMQYGDQICSHPGDACSAWLTRMGDDMTRDNLGDRRLFAPGIAAILTLANHYHQQIDSSWALMYKESVGADLGSLGDQGRK
jgi:tetratricopeptide (TPR) repeat protein